MSARGFTLIEIVVTVFLSVLVMAGVSFFFRDATDALLSSGSASHVATDMNGFPETYREMRARYPTPAYFTGAAYAASKTAFGLMAFSNAAGTAELVAGAMDSRTRALALGTGLPYAPYVPFLLEVPSADMASFAGDPAGYLSGKLATAGEPYARLELSRFAPNVLSGSVVRLDFDVVSAPDPYYYGKLSLAQMLARPDFDAVPFSIVR